MAYERPLQIVGLLIVLHFCLKSILFVWLYIRPSSLHRYMKDGGDSKDRNWALITGASDGIGQVFADELCRRGFNVVLHGRNSTKLEKVQKGLNQRHPGSQTRIIVFDANLEPSSSLERDVLPQVKDLKLSVLINNIGGTAGVQSESETYSTIDQHSVQAIDGIININARFSSQLTRTLLPVLLQRPQSLVMNISSAAELGMPYISIYSATKAYISAWSRALAREMKAEKRNVEVLGIVVASVQTTSNHQPLSFSHPTAEAFTKAALDRVGCGRASVYGHLPHALVAMFLSVFPDSITDAFVTRTMKARKAAVDAKFKKL